MQYSKNQHDSAMQANLADYFRRNGYDCEPPNKKGEVHVHSIDIEKKFHGLWVNENTNQWYCFSERKGGRNPINCLTEILKMDLPNAIHALSSEPFQKNISSPPQKRHHPRLKKVRTVKSP